MRVGKDKGGSGCLGRRGRGRRGELGYWRVEGWGDRGRMRREEWDSERDRGVGLLNYLEIGCMY